MRVLVTGSRDWDDEDLIWKTLRQVCSETGEAVTIVHGACSTGADYLADKVALFWDLPVETYPAQWSLHGRRAGYLRNKKMVDTKPDLRLAFIKNESPGATMTADMAEEAGIETRRYLA